MTIMQSDQSILINYASFDPKTKDYLFHHVVNTCLLSINLATVLGYSEEQILHVGEAALLSDLGMMLIPHQIRFKPGKLTFGEQFEIHKHPVLSIHALERIENMPELVSYVAYQHHERLSGDGYPKGRRGRLVHNFSQIVAIADIYVALTSSRSYRPPLHPTYAIAELFKMAKKGLIDTDKLNKIVSVTSVYPIGCLVQLSNKLIAKVIQSNGIYFRRPIVTIIVDEKGKVLPRGEMYQIDLLTQRDLTVEKSIDHHKFNIGHLAGF
jgi:HD-GYP domain-containing protein (c-di-GMP phosphodiesterase class II)